MEQPINKQSKSLPKEEPKDASAAVKMKGPKPPKIAILTAGGLAPCLSAAIGFLIEEYNARDPQYSMPIICYKSGYMGLLLGDYVEVGPRTRSQALSLTHRGGSPIGNSRVKLTNVADCIKRGLIKEGQIPLNVAAEQLMRDGVTVLHTIGGDDTNTQAAKLASYLKTHHYALTVVGLPKTIDNDVYPIRQSLGAFTAAEQGALFFKNIVAEHSANPRMLIIHECMGRDCGYLTAATAYRYRELMYKYAVVPSIGHTYDHEDVHGIYLPEMKMDVDAEIVRLKKVMDNLGNVSIFISEGACAQTIADSMAANGKTIPRDAFGHVKLDKLNVGQWFSELFASRLGAQKVLVQKSGYFSRAAAPNQEDRDLIRKCCSVAVDAAYSKTSGCVGQDEDQQDVLRVIEFERIKGGKHFDLKTPWFVTMMGDIGQELC